MPDITRTMIEKYCPTPSLRETFFNYDLWYYPFQCISHSLINALFFPVHSYTNQTLTTAECESLVGTLRMSYDPAIINQRCVFPGMLGVSTQYSALCTPGIPFPSVCWGATKPSQSNRQGSSNSPTESICWNDWPNLAMRWGRTVSD